MNERSATARGTDTTILEVTRALRDLHRLRDVDDRGHVARVVAAEWGTVQLAVNFGRPAGVLLLDMADLGLIRTRVLDGHLVFAGLTNEGIEVAGSDQVPHPITRGVRTVALADGTIVNNPTHEEIVMATFSVWKFDTAEGADEAEKTLLRIQKEELIEIIDAATVSWPEGKKKPKTKQLFSTTGAGTLLGGSFWGFLFGLLFFVPLLGMAVGAAAGALTGSLGDAGIDDDFIKSIRDRITPGTSALFVMSQNAVQDKVQEAFAGHHGELLHTNLTNAEEAKLREAFAED